MKRYFDTKTGKAILINNNNNTFNVLWYNQTKEELYQNLTLKEARELIKVMIKQF